LQNSRIPLSATATSSQRPVDQRKEAGNNASEDEQNKPQTRCSLTLRIVKSTAKHNGLMDLLADAHIQKLFLELTTSDEIQ
jgi:hypothetical protein